MSEETRQKLSLSNKLKESENEINRLQDQLEDEEDAKAAIQKNLTATQTQVGESQYNGSISERFLEFVAGRARNTREKKSFSSRVLRAASRASMVAAILVAVARVIKVYLLRVLRDKLHSHVTLLLFIGKVADGRCEDL